MGTQTNLRRSALRRSAGPILTGRVLGKRAVQHPAGHYQVDQTPYPHDFRPKHCAGSAACLHMHQDDDRCVCDQVILPAGTEAKVLQLRDAVVPPIGEVRPAPSSIRHSRTACYKVAASEIPETDEGASA